MGYRARAFAEEVGQAMSKETMENYAEYRKAADKLIDAYGDFLTDAEKTEARFRFWDHENFKAYKDSFYANVLLKSYSVFNESHKRYIELLNAVEKNNPEWINRVIKDHEFKISRCKVSVFPIKEALT